MIIYIGEFIGTLIFILLGLSVSANAFCSKDDKNLISTLFMSIGWAIAYVIPVLTFGEGNGPHLNPAFSIALSMFELFDKRFVIGYIICQVAGALIGCILFYLCNFKKINELKDGERQLKMFCVCPSEKNIILDFIKEFVASFAFLFGLLSITQVYGIRTEITYIFYVVVYTGIGLAFDFSNVAINPVRDVIPRLFYMIMPMKNKSKCNFLYIIVTIIAPILGCILAVYLINILPWDSAMSHG